MSYPKKHQPAPPRGGFQLFAVEMGRQVGGAWGVYDYHNAWANLSEQDRARWNAQGEAETARYKREFEEWEKEGGEAWVKRLRQVTERGVLSPKLIGSEMRKVPASCKHEAVRLMGTAVEAFLGTFAMEAFIHTNTEGKKKLGLVDMHKLIHESDARFGFLVNHFEHPSIFGPSGKKKKSKKALKEAAKLAKAAVLANAAAVSTTNNKPVKAAKQPKKSKDAKADAKEAAAEAKPVKPVHRPKMEFSNVAKFYEAKNPGGPAFETLSQPEKDYYTGGFKMAKAEFQAAEEKWKQQYPEEYEAMMKKRESDRERSRLKKAGTSGKEGNGAAGAESAAPVAAATAQNAMGGQYAQQQQQQQQLQYPVQQQMGQASQLNFRSVADPAMFAQQPIAAQRRIIVDDPNLKLPWKKVHVINNFTGAVEDEYYWNTTTNATSWEYPWQSR